jgi:hypothetical protein
MAEQSPGTAGEYRREAATVVREPRVADGVGAAVEGMEDAGAGHTADRAPRVSEGKQLATGDNTVLAASKARDLGVRTHFFPHSGTKCVRVRIRPGG